jgi:hypothetical protein
MGGQISCPARFEQGAGLTCHYTCSNGFAYTRDSSGKEKCFLVTNPKKTIALQTFPFNVTLDQATNEEKRVVSEGVDIIAKESGRQRLLDIQKQGADSVKQYESIQSRYADFHALEATNKQLKPLRVPTAPAEDLSRERQLILSGPGINLLMIQIALFFVVLSLLSFLFLSRDMAQGITFLLLSTGVGLGFFLRK